MPKTYGTHFVCLNDRKLYVKKIRNCLDFNKSNPGSRILDFGQNDLLDYGLVSPFIAAYVDP